MKAVTHTVVFDKLPICRDPFDREYACRIVGLAMIEEIIKAISLMKNIKDGVRYAFDTIEWLTVAECAFEGTDCECQDIWQYTLDMMDWAVEQVIRHDFDYLLEPITVEEVFVYPARRYGKIVLFIKDYLDVEEKKSCYHPQLLLASPG